MRARKRAKSRTSRMPPCGLLTTPATDKQTIAYAMSGPAHSPYLALWNRTWLQGKPHVFVPDRPQGPWAALHRPARSYLANMLWSAHDANASFPEARWVLVTDIDTLPFERSVREVAAGYDWREPIAIGTPHKWRGSHRDQRLLKHAGRCTAETRLCEALDVRQVIDNTRCCFCPVVQRGGEWEINQTKQRSAGSNVVGAGTVSFRAPALSAVLYGGTGILLSRGLLNAIPASEWVQCTRQLVCGAADHRLLTCITNLLPAVCVVRMTENTAFMTAALSSPDEDALPPNVRINSLWSAMQKDPLRGPRILRHFSNATAEPRCPWSMHKLHRGCVPDVYRASRHCHADESSAWVSSSGPGAPQATQPCWHAQEEAERRRLGRRHGRNTSGVPFEVLYGWERGGANASAG